MEDRVLLLDSEGLSLAVRGDRRMGVLIRQANRRDIPVLTTSMTLIEAYDNRAKPAAWQWTLSKCKCVR